MWRLAPSFIRTPNPSAQVANGHCSKDPPPQPIQSHLRLEKAESLPILESAFGSGAPTFLVRVGGVTRGLERGSATWEEIGIMIERERRKLIG